MVAIAAASVVSAAPAAPSILVYGDSLSSAYGIARQRGWVALLETRLKSERADYSVVNASISGETTRGGLARMPKVLADVKPAIVILELGANDGLRGLPIDQMKRNLGAMIEQAQRSGAKVLLVGMKMPPNWGPDYTEAFEQVYPALAKTHGTALLPFLFEELEDSPQHFQADLMHPSEAAQPIIADTVWTKLAPLL